MRVLTVFGTRPEIIKLSPLIPLLDKEFEHTMVHTGQHYTYEMDRVFFDDLRLRNPDYRLDIGSATHGKQTAKMMVKIEDIIIDEIPDFVLVQGDTNSTLSGALACAKLDPQLAHVEAGCRAFNKIPEEINRVITDHVADILFAPEEKSLQNLVREGISKEKIFVVGDTVVDACLRAKRFAENSSILKDLGLKKSNYAVLTIHRAENTDNAAKLKEILSAICDLNMNVVFPVHPRTEKTIRNHGMKTEGITMCPPLGYIDFINLLSKAFFCMTDSGGIQVEAALLSKPCLILRTETEWSYLVEASKNVLVGNNYDEIHSRTKYFLDHEDELENLAKAQIDISPHASKKIVEILRTFA